MGHSERAHSLLSASSAHIWINCPPSARLGEQFPDRPTDAAAEGTLAHELAELRLRNYFQTVDFGKAKYTRAVNKLKKEDKWNEEMLEYTVSSSSSLSRHSVYPSGIHPKVIRWNCWGTTSSWGRAL